MTPAGRRYVAGSSTILLFVRQARGDGEGKTTPFTFLGPVRYEQHEGGRPMRVIWRMETAIPPWFLRRAEMAG